MKGLKGTMDYWPNTIRNWQHVEKQLISTVEHWGYEEVRTPILEPEAVFVKLGTDSDIVGKQMYRIQNDTPIVLRPEGTSGIVRSGIEHHTITRSTAKVWYYGPMFRHERPQQGRLREFHQFGAEVFGYANVAIEAEMLDMLMQLWKKLNIDQVVTLELHTIGGIESRQRYKKALLEYLMPLQDQLDLDSQTRLRTNPMRILDSKDAATQKIIDSAPLLSTFLTDKEHVRMEQLLAYLQDLGHSWFYNKKLVRGLDYYNDLVFEFTTTKLGAQGTICAGGRFNGLALQWGHNIPAVGFSIGMERIMALVDLELSSCQAIIAFTQVTEASSSLIKLLNALRKLYPGPVIYDASDSNFKNKYHRALKSKPQCILTIEDQEWQQQTCCLRIPGQLPLFVAWDPVEIIQKCQIV